MLHTINKFPSKKFFLFFLIIFLSSQFKNYSQTLEDRISNIISQMTLDEKIKQLHQEGGMNTADNVRLKIPGFLMSDGPHGVRNGFATSFPVGIGLAATWDSSLVYRVGTAMGEEFRGKGIHQALGPCLDLTLDPRNGRTPESGGEDPYLNSVINTNVVRGIQSTGEIATVKHFYSEYRQNGRTSNDYSVSQRMFMEHHGLQFRDAVQLGGAMSLMNAYNLINGQKCAENSNLLTNILRSKWGFPYYVVSDWASIWNTERAIKAGCDIDMGDLVYQDAATGLKALVTAGKVSQSTIDDAVRRVLRTKILSGLLDYYPAGNPSDVNSTAHQTLCLEAGKKGIVLLKNQNNILPLNKNAIGKIAVIGPNANEMKTDGTGSSWVEPFYKISPRQGIENYLGTNKVLYAQGCDIGNDYTVDLSNALDYAKQADVVVFFGGLDQTQEGEGSDRSNGSIELPGKQKDLILSLAKQNPNIIVVLISGGICSVNYFVNDIKGLIYAFYPGQEGGNAIAQVLFGDYNPTGKLPVTMPKNDGQMPDRMKNNFDANFGGGYRWFDKNNLVPEFAFGYGLSYTTFSYSNLAITPTSAPAGQIIQISVDITNTGTRNGGETAQLYLTDDQSSVAMPVKQLKGFQRVNLNAGETKTVTFQITPSELYYYDETSQSYKVEPGMFTARVGGSSDNLPLSEKFEITSSTPKPDLQIANIRTVPPYPLKGDKVIFLATVINRGTGASPEGVNHEIIFGVNGKQISRSTEFNHAIPAGGMALICGNLGINSTDNFWTAEKPGTYNINATVNANSTIDETISSNNYKNVSLKVYDAPPVNLALNKYVTTSTIEKLGLDGFYAVDGNLTTRWSSQFYDPQWIVIDFGSVTTFNQIKLDWEAAYGKEYSIQISNDNANWTTLISQTKGFGGIEQYNVSASAARYLRIYGTKRGTQYGYSLYEIEIYNVTNPTSVNEKENEIPFNFKLSNNYPNPFNPSTTINYEISKPGNVKIEIFNSLGQLVKVLADSFHQAGRYNLIWNGDNSSGNSVSSGVYFYRMNAEGFTLVKKMILMK